VDNSRRDLHGGLIDAQLLADVYLAMTSGQVAFDLGFDGAAEQRDAVVATPVVLQARPRVQRASADELSRHEQRLDALDKSGAEGLSVWRRIG
jgi:DNA polymerase-3 subunit epsilon